ncbi:MAG: PKD domain-containing protein [Bacteroidia bacterium]|nr:PKD domain-containing protein [Bacteroidia bacterium]
MKNFLFPVLLAFVVMLSGCITPPQSCFEADVEFVDAGESVSFANCSFGASSFAWDFGDGTTSTKKSPTHAYSSPGTYKVTLTIENKSGDASTSATNIVVGERKIASIKVLQIPATNPLGDPWDTGSDPDLVFAIGRTANSPNWDLETDEKTDLSAGLPFTWDVSTSDVVMTDEEWTWELRDEDGAIDDVLGTGTFETYQVGTNYVITLTATDLMIELRYELQ